LEGTRVDLEKQLAFFDERSVDIILRDKIAGDLRANLGIDHAISEADPLADNGDIFLDRRHDGDDELWRLRFLLGGTSGQDSKNKDDREGFHRA
jgi:hypothetical protein